MTKGKPWTREEEEKLRELMSQKVSVGALAREFNKSKGAVYAKVDELGLKVEKPQKTKKRVVTTSQLEVLKTLPSIEEALAMLASAMKKACEPGLDKLEVRRLQLLGSLVEKYKEVLAAYLDYRGLEEEMKEWKRKYEELDKKSKSNASA